MGGTEKGKDGDRKRRCERGERGKAKGGWEREREGEREREAKKREKEKGREKKGKRDKNQDRNTLSGCVPQKQMCILHVASVTLEDRKRSGGRPTGERKILRKEDERGDNYRRLIVQWKRPNRALSSGHLTPC